MRLMAGQTTQKINELEDVKIETIQSKTQREKKILKSKKEKSIIQLQDNFKQPKKQVIRAFKEEERGRKKI